MTNKKYKSISISNLIINPDNDRFESVENEKQAIDNNANKIRRQNLLYCDTYFREWVVSQAILCYAIKEI